VIDIRTLTLLAGSLPVAKRDKVLDWTSTRQDILVERFAAAIAHDRVEPII
jgi:hypothetical protein